MVSVSYNLSSHLSFHIPLMLLGCEFGDGGVSMALGKRENICSYFPYPVAIKLRDNHALEKSDLRCISIKI